MNSQTMIMQFSPAAKTAEIMSRYRPIAPKPEVPPLNPMFEIENPSMSPKISQSTYLRNLWPRLQTRPTRTRKRCRTSISPITLKRIRPTSFLVGLSSLHGFPQWPPPPHLPMPNLTPLNTSLEMAASIVTSPESLVTLPLLPYPPLASVHSCGGEREVIDLNTMSAIDISEQNDHQTLLQLRGPTTASNNVISPRPIRPVGSSILVGCISEDDPKSIHGVVQQLPKKAEEVEEEMESESLPAVVSDSNNKVRLANSAYKEMVGQPECSWLDSMVTTSDGGRACKRIGGEVMLRFSESGVPGSSKAGFSCWVNIEWGNNGDKKLGNVFCDVIRLMCESKDYLFAWRFHTRTPEVSLSSSLV